LQKGAVKMRNTVRSAVRKSSILFFLLLFIFVITSNNITRTSAVNIEKKPTVNTTACITSTPLIASDQSKFPDVKVNLRLINFQNSPITGLVNSDLQVQENGSAPVFSKSINPGSDTGADFYFVIDSGNRTDPLIVKKTLGSFLEKMSDGNDSISIISDVDNSYTSLANNITSKDKLLEIIQSLPDQKSSHFYTLYEALDQTFKAIDKQASSCARPLFVVVISGDLSFDNPESRGYDFSSYFNKNYSKLFFIHPGLNINYQYKTFAENANGQYIDIPSYDQVSELTRLTDSIPTYRTTYDVIYRTNNGGSGNHLLQINYQGQAVAIDGPNTYSIQLEQPQISMSAQDSNIIRLANKKTEGGYIFDKDTTYVDVKIDWKGYPRGISSAKVLVDGSTPIDVNMEKISDSEYRFAWDMSSFDQRGDFVAKLQLQIFDELNEGIAERVTTGNTTIEISNKVPASLMTTWLLYGLYGLFAVLVVAFLIWRKKITASIVKGGKNIGQAIRKTFVGNRSNKPIASLQIIDGPNNMIGKDLPVFSEAVTLGRDPAKSDLIFFGPDSVTSVSGSHCKLQKLQSGWQIIAVSTSRSETYLDETPLPFLNPVSISEGQKVRMGYLGQQPVEFVFHIKETSSYSNLDPRKTKTDTAMPGGSVIKKQSFVPDISLASKKDANQNNLQETKLPPPPIPQIIDNSSPKDSSAFDEFR
jgi:hypothetical protein